MKWEKIYSTKLCSPEKAVTNIKSGDNVVFGHAISEPPVLVDAMVRNADSYKNVTILHSYSQGEALYTKPELKENFRYAGWFASQNTRKSILEGYGDYAPVHLNNIARYAKFGIIDVDVFMVMVTPPDDNGYFHACCSSDWVIAMKNAAKKILVQVNDQAPLIYGDNKIHIDEVNCIVETSHPIAEYISPPPDEISIMIADNCSELIKNGSTLQIGIGEIPEAILSNLSNHKNLGIHSEMISDGVMDLIKKGIITNTEKSLDKGMTISTFLMGSRRFYDFANKNESIFLKTADYTNNPAIISQQSNFVSINSCIEVDLMGQVVADCIGTKQFSGIGGQMNFISGCDMSIDGSAVSIIALNSVNLSKDGTRSSKIVPYIHFGAAVSDTRADVDFIVTEFGAVRLKGKPLQERARLLISIAHPDFKDELIHEFQKRFNTIF